MSLLSLRILRISKHSQKLKLAHDFYSYCFARSLLHVQPLRFFYYVKVYFNKPVMGIWPTTLSALSIATANRP